MARMMCPTSCWQLAGFLQESYPDSRDERPTSPSGLFEIRIDDYRPGDTSPYFCSLWISIQNTEASRLTLHLKNPPLDDEVTRLIRAKKGKMTGLPPDLHVEIPVLTRDGAFLRELAKAFRRVVGRGRTYLNPNWKWICPRTAASLERLADRLLEYRRLRRQPSWRSFASSSLAYARDCAGPGSPTGCSRAGATTRSPQADEEDIFRLLGAE